MFKRVTGRAMLGFLCAALGIIAANAAIVRAKDPLLFWSAKATKDQPFFTLPSMATSRDMYLQV